MISHAEYMELLAGSIGFAILGIVAGTVRFFRYGYKGLKHLAGGMVRCVFTAVTVGFLLDMTDWPPTVVTALVGLSGYFGGTLLDAALWRVNKEIRTARIPGVRSDHSQVSLGDAED